MIEFSGADTALFLTRGEWQKDENVKEVEEGERVEIKKGPTGRAGFDRLFAKRLWAILRVLFARAPTEAGNSKGPRCGHVGMVLVLLVCGVVVLQALTSSLTGRVIGDVYTAMSTKNLGLFWSVLGRGSLVMVASVVLDAAIKLLTDLLALAWRRTLVVTMQNTYFADGVYYRLNALDGRVDNPDMRLTQDIDNFTATLATVVQQCASGPVIIALYTWFCWRSIAWYAPFLVFAYFVLGFFVTRALANPIAALVFVQERLEGDFRFVHTWVRNMAEASALSGGRAREEDLAQDTFVRLYRNKRRIVWWQGGLALTSNVFTYFGSIVNYCVVALAIFVSGASHTISDVSADCFYCIMLISGWSVFFNSSKLLSDLAGYTARLGHMFEVANDVSRLARVQKQEHALAALAESKAEEDENSATVSTSTTAPSAEAIAVRHVTTYTPDRRVLARDVSFVVEPGCNFQVTGPSGCGKSTLLKVVHGIWPYYDGVVDTPTFAPTQIQYLPQRPYNCHHMSLSEQITSPFRNVHLEHSELARLLGLLDLGHLLDAPDSEMDDDTREWHSTLSLGEQQRLCFLRVLYHRPRFAVLDESTSALDAAMEARCYTLLLDAGITLISVGHRDTIRKFHNVELHFSSESDKNEDSNGFSWSLKYLA